MKILKQIQLNTALIIISCGLSSIFPSSLFAEEHNGNDFFSALTGGKFSFSSRYRYEHVDDDRFSGSGAPLKNADASTLRTALGYETGEFHHFALGLEIENVLEIGPDDFNNVSNRKTQFATVVDPDGTEVDQAYVHFTGLPDTKLKAGRQYLTYRKAPFHRFIGTILWRQNWQTFDAFTAVNTSLPDTTISYAYTWNINRIFGEDAAEPLDNFSSDSHLVNIKYKGLSFGQLEGYAYLLDFDNALAFSTQTYGLRFNGKRPVAENINALYTAEYAHQSDYEDNPADIDADYFLGEIGANFKFGGIVESLTVKFSYELLSGDGGADRFVTILGTNHAFQGWADRFLVTPGDGIEDYIFTAVAKIWGAKFIAAYHSLESDNMGYDYGDEIDLLLAKTFKKHYTVGVKYSAYDADRNASNVARNGSNSGVANDVEKLWVWAQVKF